MLWVVMCVFVLLFSLVVALIDDVLNYLNLNLFNLGLLLWLVICCLVFQVVVGASGGGVCGLWFV